MIKVSINYKGKGFESIEVKGHANTAEHGKDLVCAGTSTVIVGSMNALENPDGFEIIIEEGHFSCVAKEKVSEHDEIVLEVLIIQLKTLELSNKRVFDIKERKK